MHTCHSLADQRRACSDFGLKERRAADNMYDALNPPRTWMAANETFTFSVNEPTSSASCHHYTALSDEEKDLAERTSQLRFRWNKAVRKLASLLGGRITTARSEAIGKIESKWFEKLKEMHSEPSRFYHTLVHLEEMLGYLDIFAKLSSNETEKEVSECLDAVSCIATFFHDAVYDPTSSSNEEDSVRLFQSFSEELTNDCAITPCLDLVLSWVSKYILATKSHNPRDTSISQIKINAGASFEAKLAYHLSLHLRAFLDADMSVLAKDSNAYKTYAGLIRKEYEFVVRDTYCQKRAEILRSFIGLRRIEDNDVVDETKHIFGTDAMKAWFEQKARQNLLEEIHMLERGVIPCEEMSGH